MSNQFPVIYSAIPVLTQEGIIRYVEHKIPPGSFLSAVLCNDLRTAVFRADKSNIQALRLIVEWFDAYHPSLYGRENFLAHLKKNETETV